MVAAEWKSFMITATLKSLQEADLLFFCHDLSGQFLYKSIA